MIDTQELIYETTKYIERLFNYKKQYYKIMDLFYALEDVIKLDSEKVEDNEALKEFFTEMNRIFDQNTE